LIVKQFTWRSHINRVFIVDSRSCRSRSKVMICVFSSFWSPCILLDLLSRVYVEGQFWVSIGIWWHKCFHTHIFYWLRKINYMNNARAYDLNITSTWENESLNKLIIMILKLILLWTSYYIIKWLWLVSMYNKWGF
jgi:hypothetical protein